MLNKIFIILFLAIGIGGILFTQDLEQKNKETIFLTAEGISSYKSFQEEFKEKDILVVKKDYPNIVTDKDKSTFEFEAYKVNKGLDLFTPEKLEKTKIKLLNLEGPKFLAMFIIGEKDDSRFKEVITNISRLKYWGSRGENLHLSGMPYTNFLLDQYSKSIKETLFPMLFVGVFLFILLFTRSLKSSLIIFFPCLLSASLSLSVTKMILGETNLVNSIIPLLMFVINLSVVLHVFYTAIQLGSIQEALDDKKRPIGLMILTTFIGFSSLYLSSLQAIKEFGLFTGLLILITCCASLYWLYFCGKVFDFLPKKKKPIELFHKGFKNFFPVEVITSISIMCVVIGILSFNKIEIITDATKYFPKSSGLRESIQNVGDSVIGTPILDVIIKKDADLVIEDYQEIDLFERKLTQDKKRKILSLNSIITSINHGYTGEEKIPENINAYMLQGGFIPESIRDGFPVGETYKMTILSNPIDVKEYEVLLGEIQTHFKGTNYKIEFNGIYYHLMVAQKEMITTLFKSFLASLIIISFIAFIFFKKPRLFFIFLFVNTIPVLGSFGLLYLFGLSFNIATVMTYSISLGLIVDSSFHIIHALEKEDLTYDFFYQTIVLPILKGSLLLSICFFMFALNGFLPIQQFGICLGIIIFLGMIFDLKVLPTLFMKRSKIF